MKKTYITPTIAVEHYELTQSIASCSIKISMSSSECVIKDSDSTDQMKDYAYSNWFIDGCGIYAEDMEGETGICYHTNANAAFTS